MLFTTCEIRHLLRAWNAPEWLHSEIGHRPHGVHVQPVLQINLPPTGTELV
jgi:hypothetical protein